MFLLRCRNAHLLWARGTLFLFPPKVARSDAARFQMIFVHDVADVSDCRHQVSPSLSPSTPATRCQMRCTLHINAANLVLFYSIAPSVCFSCRGAYSSPFIPGHDHAWWWQEEPRVFLPDIFRQPDADRQGQLLLSAPLILALGCPMACAFNLEKKNISLSCVSCTRTHSVPVIRSSLSTADA